MINEDPQSIGEVGRRDSKKCQTLSQSNSLMVTKKNNGKGTTKISLRIYHCQEYNPGEPALPKYKGYAETDQDRGLGPGPPARLILSLCNHCISSKISSIS
jgi:hypothetical protein